MQNTRGLDAGVTDSKKEIEEDVDSEEGRYQKIEQLRKQIKVIPCQTGRLEPPKCKR